MAEQLIRNEQVACSIHVTSSSKSLFCLQAKEAFAIISVSCEADIISYLCNASVHTAKTYITRIYHSDQIPEFPAKNGRGAQLLFVLVLLCGLISL